MNQISWRGEDQFDTFIFSPEDYFGSLFGGFDLIQLRKKRDDNPDSYEYRIGKNAFLTTDNVKNVANIIKPKPPGEWIDLTLKEKELYLYLECVFSVSSRDSNNVPSEYKISSAKLITAEEESLPSNFSGTHQVKQTNDGYSYYEITLGRHLLAVFSKNDLPISFYRCYGIQLKSMNFNGFVKPVI